MRKGLLITIIIIVAFLVLGALFYYFQYYKEKEEADEPETFGEMIYEKAKNPAEEFPETNPFDVKTNPFE